MNVDFVVLCGDDVRAGAVGPLDLPVGLPLWGDTEDSVPPDNLDWFRGERAVRGACCDRDNLDG